MADVDWRHDEGKAKRKGKDSIFIDLFHQPKYAVEMVQTLHPEQYVRFCHVLCTGTSAWAHKANHGGNDTNLPRRKCSDRLSHGTKKGGRGHHVDAVQPRGSYGTVWL